MNTYQPKGLDAIEPYPIGYLEKTGNDVIRRELLEANQYIIRGLDSGGVVLECDPQPYYLLVM